MAQRPIRGNTPVQKPNQLLQEDDPATKPQEKPQGQGAIDVVKSKIREKDAPRQEEDSMSGTKISPNKIIPRPKKHKRGSSAENAVKEDATAIDKSDTKSERIDLKQEDDNSKSDIDLALDTEAKSGENLIAVPETKSKKSIAKIVQSKKSIGPTQEEETEIVQTKKSEIKSQAESFISTNAALSTKVSSTPETQEQSSESQMLMKNTQSDFIQTIAKKSFLKPTSPPSQKNERKNYLANLSPSPLEEYPTDEEESKEAKEQDKTNTKQE